MPASSMALIFSSVPYFVSKVNLSGSQVPAEANMPEEIKHRLVLHDLCWGHQSRTNHAVLSCIDHVMGLIAKMKWSPTLSHRSSIRVSGADPLLRAAWIEP